MRRARSKVSAASTAAATTAAVAASAAAAAGSTAASAAAAPQVAATGRPAAWAAASPLALPMRSGPPPSFRRWVAAAAGRTRQRSNEQQQTVTMLHVVAQVLHCWQQPSAKLSTAPLAPVRGTGPVLMSVRLLCLCCCIGCAAGTGGWPTGSGAGRLPAAVGVQRAPQRRSLPLYSPTFAAPELAATCVCCPVLRAVQHMHHHAHTQLPVLCGLWVLSCLPTPYVDTTCQRRPPAHTHTHMSPKCTAATMSQLQDMAVVLTVCWRAAGCCPAGLCWVW